MVRRDGAWVRRFATLTIAVTALGDPVHADALRPGRYEVAVEIIADTFALPAHVDTVCRRGEPGPEDFFDVFSTGESCTLTDDRSEDKTIELQFHCQDGDFEMESTISGTYGDESIELEMVHTMGEETLSTFRMKSRRIGACP